MAWVLILHSEFASQGIRVLTKYLLCLRTLRLTLKHNLSHKLSSCCFRYQRQRFLPFPNSTTVTLEPHQRCGWSPHFFCLSSFCRNFELRSRCWLDTAFFYHSAVFVVRTSPSKLTIDMHRPTSVLVGSVGIEPLYAKPLLRVLPSHPTPYIK